MMNTVAVTSANKTGGSLRGWDNTKDFAIGTVVPFGWGHAIFGILDNPSQARS
jgi:hypothetical protein